MLHFKIVTYTQDLINKSTINSVTLLTKDGKEVSVLVGGEEEGVMEHVATYDESLKTFIVEKPIIGATIDYDEAEMLEMFDGASIVYADALYDGDTLFSKDIWIREVSLRNDDRYVSIERAIPRNFWNHAFGPFKAQQRNGHRNFDVCYQQALEEYQRHDLEDESTQYDSNDKLTIARAIAHDVWDIHNAMVREEREQYLRGL